MSSKTFSVLGGKVQLKKDSPRPSEDALWLASTVNAKESEELLEVGSGSGVVSLCLWQRLPHIYITGIDIQEELSVLAQENAQINNCSNFTSSREDITCWNSVKKFNHSFSNPPFHQTEKGFKTPCQKKEIAHGTNEKDAIEWFKKMLKATKEGGTVTLIHHQKFTQTLLKHTNHMTKIIELVSSPHKKPKRVIIQTHVGIIGDVEYFTVNTYDKKIRQAILEHGENLWAYVKKRDS